VPDRKPSPENDRSSPCARFRFMSVSIECFSGSLICSLKERQYVEFGDEISPSDCHPIISRNE
jgi:hypothetical protein